MSKKMEMEEGLALARKNEKGDQKQTAFMLLTEAIWKINFLRDVACANGLTADQDHVGITVEGEQGLGIILQEVGQDLSEAMDLF